MNDPAGGGDAPRDQELIYDWNLHEPVEEVRRHIELDDETLRDGLQSPSVTDPSIEWKKRLLHLMDRLGIDTADIGLPGAGPRAVQDVTELCREIATQNLSIKANCAGRTMVRDVEPMVRISDDTGVEIEACLFIGSSPIRQYTENWTLDSILGHTEESVSYAVDHGLPVMFVTEDTTRARPEDVRKMYTTAVECGARRVCVCDTVGHATPEGVASLIGFVREVVRATGEDIKVDWHGHRDRGMDLANTLTAIRAGADRVHGCGLGVGERSGNTPMDLILVNLKLLGWIDRDLSALAEYCNAVSEACGVPIPTNYPVVGADAFETGTGVHAAAVIKAFRKGDAWLADRVYSGVPAGEFGLRQRIRVGPMSGRSNVIYWLEEHAIEAGDELVDRIFQAAKQSNRLLEDEEILALTREG